MFVDYKVMKQSGAFENILQVINLEFHNDQIWNKSFAEIIFLEEFLLYLMCKIAWIFSQDWNFYNKPKYFFLNSKSLEKEDKYYFFVTKFWPFSRGFLVVAKLKIHQLFFWGKIMIKDKNQLIHLKCRRLGRKNSLWTYRDQNW